MLVQLFSRQGSASAACPRPGADWIEVQLELGANDTPEHQFGQLEQRVIEHLRAEFSSQGIDVCSLPSAAASPPLATLKITRDSPNAAEVRAWANDAVTHKELTRRLSLEGLPADTHAMAIALGASELVTASWIELRLGAAREQRAHAPASVQSVVAASEGDSKRHGSIAIRAATDAFTAGVRQFGLDASLRVLLAKDFNAALRLGARSAMQVAAPHGSVAASGWALGVGASWTMARPTRGVSLELDATSNFQYIDFNPSPDRRAVAHSASGFAWWVAGGVGSELALAGQLAFELGVEAGVVILPVTATDAGIAVTGIAQGVVAGHAGIRVPF
jgi:hypothetical protein